MKKGHEFVPLYLYAVNTLTSRVQYPLMMDDAVTSLAVRFICYKTKGAVTATVDRLTWGLFSNTGLTRLAYRQIMAEVTRFNQTQFESCL